MHGKICARCGNPRRERANRPGTYAGAHEWCGACTERWRRDGRPAEGPPPPMTPAQRNALVNWERSRGREWRLAEFRRMRDAGYTVAQAAKCLGVTYKAGWQYEQELRDPAVTREDQPPGDALAVRQCRVRTSERTPRRQR